MSEVLTKLRSRQNTRLAHIIPLHTFRSPRPRVHLISAPRGGAAAVGPGEIGQLHKRT